ncbi:MAG: response regulator, partial [Armatimonadota bacterium]|nr:response regulator [Armatimonadota bacterium]
MQPRILIADDSPTVVDLVRHVLESAGFRVLTAPDGLAAMNIALRELPNLIISDVEMPEMTGLQLCRLLKGDPRTSAIPFVILSVHKEQHEQFWGRETGADDYLPKPFTPEGLLSCVNALLARAPRVDQPVPAVEMPDATRLDALERVNASLERRLFELTVVHGISAIAATTTGERDTARALLERVSRLVDFSAGALVFSPGGRCYLLIRRGIHPEALQAFHTRLMAAVPPAGDAPPPAPVILSGAEFISPRADDAIPATVLQPLGATDNLIGVLGAARDAARRFEEPERDMLQLVAKQSALVLENARLQEKERANAAALARQNEELRRLNTTITDLIRTVTHDLRTPLNSVLGYLELVREDETLSEESREYLEVVQRNADRMLRMVNGLLDISRLESGRLSVNPRPTELRPVLD